MSANFGITMIRNGSGELCGSHSEVADELVEAFSSSFSSEPHSSLPEIQTFYCGAEISDIEIDEKI